MGRPRRLVTLTLFLLLATRMAAAEPAVTSRLHWVTNGIVRAAAVQDQTLYIGGSFTRVAPAANFLGPWFGVSTATGEPIARLPLADGLVYAVEPDGAGGYFVGGRFGHIGGVRRAGLAHVLADGRVDPAFAPALLPVVPSTSFPAPPDVRSLARVGGTLYVGGQFQMSTGSDIRMSAVAMDTATGTLLPWHANVTFTVEKLLVEGSTVFLMGQAMTVPPTVTARDATSGAALWSRTLGGGTVLDAVRAGSRLVVAGGFAGADSSGIAGVASLDPATGALDTSWAPHRQQTSDNRSIHAVTVVGATVYVGGTFAAFGGQPRSNVAAVDLVTGSLTGWAPEVDGIVRELTPASGASVYIGGAFGHVAGLARAALAEVDATGAPTSWVAGAYSTDVRTLYVAGSVLLAGGASAVAGGVARDNLAAFRLDTDEVTPWAPVGHAGITDLAAGGGRVFAGGRLQSPDYREFVSAFEASDGSPAQWSPPPSDTVTLLDVIDGQVYLATNTALVPSLVRLDAVSAALDTSWRFTATPIRIVADRDAIYLVGHAPVIDTGRRQLAAVHARTGAVSPWNPSAVPAIPARLVRAPAAAVMGRTLFAAYHDDLHQEHGVVAVDTVSGLPVHFPVVPASRVVDVATADELVITLQAATATSKGGVVAYRPDGARADWTPGLSLTDSENALGEKPRVFTTATDVVVTGVQALGASPVHGIAVLARQTAAAPATLDAKVIDNAVRLEWTPSAPAGAVYGLEVGSAAGRSDLLTQDTGRSEASLDAFAPSGTYFVRIRGGAPGGTGPATNEIALRVGCAAPPAQPPTALAIRVAGTHVTVEWEPVPFVPVTRYVIEAGASAGARDLARIAVPGSWRRYDVEAPTGTYFVRIRAENACGSGPATPDVWVTVGDGPLPPAPAGLSVTPVGPMFPVPTYIVQWQPVDAVTAYILEAGSQPGLADLAILQTSQTSVGPVAVEYGRTYYVRVRAVGAGGIGPPGPEFVVIAR